MTFMANLFSLVVACVAGVGPVVLLAFLLNRRDHRAEALYHEVSRQLPPDALRSDVALDVRCGLFSQGATVRLDLGRVSSPHLWETAARLRRELPGWVRLEVDGHVEGPPTVSRPVRITVVSPTPEPLRQAA